MTIPITDLVRTAWGRIRASRPRSGSLSVTFLRIGSPYLDYVKDPIPSTIANGLGKEMWSHDYVLSSKKICHACEFWSEAELKRLHKACPPIRIEYLGCDDSKHCNFDDARTKKHIE
jgi:hypothetical protein